MALTTELSMVEDEVLDCDIVPNQIGSIVPQVSPGPKWELRKLTARHRRIVQLKVAGLPREDIGKMCKCRPEYISMLLQQKLVRDYLAEKHLEVDDDLRDLMGPAVDTMRLMLSSPDDKVALSASTTVLRANGKLGQNTDDDERVTAEDVVARLFSIANSNVQINIGKDLP